MHAATAVTGALLFGLVTTCLAGLRPAHGEKFGEGLGKSEAFRSVLPILLAPLLLLAGLGVDAWDIKPVLILGCLGASLGLFCLTQEQFRNGAMIAAVLCAVGGAGVGMASLLLMPGAFILGEAPASVNLGYGFLALGILSTPPLLLWLTAKVGLRRTLNLLALACLVPGLLVATLDVREVVDAAAGRTTAQRTEVILDSQLWLAAALAFAYLPLELAVVRLAEGHLGGHGLTPRHVRLWLASFWTAIFGSRVLVAILLHHGWLRGGDQVWMLLVLALLLAVLMGHLSGSVNRSRSLTGLVLLGALLGPFLPTLLGMAIQHFSAAPGTASGTVAAAAVLGGVSMAPLTERFARRNPVFQVWRYLALIALLLVCFALVLALKGGLPRPH